jgi:16S rRNA (cytidine1402-2'-O)-methyltransferase
MTIGTLYLIPVPLGNSSVDSVLPASVIDRARQLTHFVAENAKSARLFLKALPCETPLQQIDIQELSEHTSNQVLPELLRPLLAGKDLGLISEAGCPAVADPGAQLVEIARRKGIRVVPLVGPSSILLALMGSGLSGQNFAFHGYLPIKEEDRQKKLRELEKDSRHEKRTQIFIETPYRNRQMLETLLKACAPNTRICLATDLTLASEYIATRTTALWQREESPDIDRRPTVFLLQA